MFKHRAFKVVLILALLLFKSLVFAESLTSGEVAGRKGIPGGRVGGGTRIIPEVIYETS